MARSAAADPHSQISRHSPRRPCAFDQVQVGIDQRQQPRESGLTILDAVHDLVDAHEAEVVRFLPRYWDIQPPKYFIRDDTAKGSPSQSGLCPCFDKSVHTPLADCRGAAVIEFNLERFRWFDDLSPEIELARFCSINLVRCVHIRIDFR